MRAPLLETRTNRLKLSIARKPYWVKIGLGIALGYRRNVGSGTWSVRVSSHGKQWIERIAIADDYDAADGEHVRDFWQAQARARELGSRHDYSAKLITVRQAIDRYAADLQSRGGRPNNVGRILAHLPASLAGKTVATLKAADFAPWRDALAAAGISKGGINRSNAAFRAVLNLAAKQDERVTNHTAWGKALASIPGAAQARNIILCEDEVRRIVAAAYGIGREFGLLIETLAISGTRPSQAFRLEASDLQADRPDPRLMMPSSFKGRHKRIERRPVPIPASLAGKLAAAAQGRPADAPLLCKPDGTAWTSPEYFEPFARARAAAGLGPEVTCYSLRHSSVVRQLLAGIPVRIVAAGHDTSVNMLEQIYSKFIGDHSDALVRRSLLVTAEPPAGDNVVSIATRG
jgi:integrase